ncbi:MAG: PAS domain-containing protein [Candidatus Eisenbacteria bacterium]|uniref:histidine kinase n=1 Tax=Eiseniibacteriota bacterium TaxID=2212470 RepID=A0A933W907_UNCEI|nr:PAS domain-containing protein [Candidatus Eisenbacteria bacterium]
MPTPSSPGHVPGFSGASFERVLDRLPAPVWLSTLDGRALWLNHAWLQFVGSTHETALDRPWSDWVHPDDHAAVVSVCGSAVERHEPFEAEARMRRHDGRWRRMLNRGEPFLDAEGRCIAYVGSLTDITERREAQDRMQLVLDHLGAPAFLFTADGRYLFVNEEWNVLFNPARVPAIGRNITEFLPAEQVQEILRTNAIAVGTGRRYEYEVTLSTVDGPRAFLAKKFPLRDEHGELSILCGIATELTEVRKREQHTRDLESQLLEARHMESLGVLAGGVAHDFNNLMQAVLGYAGLAAVDVPPDSPAQAWIEEIARSARRAADLTRQLLDFAGRPALRTEETELVDLLRDWESPARIVAPPPVRLELLLPETLPRVIVDTLRLQQMFSQFVGNSVEAFDGNPGTITLRAGIRTDDAGPPTGHRFADAVPSGECVFVEVNDDGPGMDEETAARVFEPFFTTHFAGRGLGLSAALGIARAHGGTIGLATAPGHGASFRVLLPVAQPSRSASRNAAP